MKYNVKILGYSIGITNNLEEAIQWYYHSPTPARDKQILIMSVCRHN